MADRARILIAGAGIGGLALAQALRRGGGRRCVYGRMTIDEATDALVPENVDRGFCWVADEHGYGAGLATVRFRSRPKAHRTTS